MDNHHAIGIVTAIGIAVLGAIIASRKPRNPIGWLMSVAALLLGVVNVTQRYAPLAVAEALPLVGFSSWLVAAATRSAELLGVVDQTVQPARTSLWLRRAEDARS